MALEREVKFCVKVPLPLTSESVFVVGDCDSLGNWLPRLAAPLQFVQQSQESQIWAANINVPSSLDKVSFRFFIGHRVKNLPEDTKNNVIIKTWETNLKPRCLQLSDDAAIAGTADDPLIYGTYGGKTSIQKGWLTCQSEIHLRLHSNPVKCKIPGPYAIRCAAVDKTDEEEDSPGDDNANINPVLPHEVLVSVLKEGQSKKRAQPEHGGTILQENDFMTFSVQTCHPETLGFSLEIFKAHGNDNAKIIGKTLIASLKNNFGHITGYIINKDHHVAGEIKVEYLIIRPLPYQGLDMKVSYAQHWKSDRAALDIGHRGSGNSYHVNSAKIKENTIRSLQYAGETGADFVEFDVQLSQDRVPVVYHDFNVCVAVSEASSDEIRWHPVPVQNLNLSQMKSLKFGHMSELGKAPLKGATKDEHDLLPFPTLEQCFKEIHPHVGFNIEIKYCMILKSGVMEEGLQFFEERNSYLDRILEVMLPLTSDRRIVFSSFDPDICTILSVKQRIFPVFFLTLGETKQYPAFSDPRTSNVPLGSHFAYSEALMGVAAHAEDLLKEPSLIKEIKALGLQVLSWGNDNNSKDNIDTQKKHGVDGVIYDKVYELKGSKGNVFMAEHSAKTKSSS